MVALDELGETGIAGRIFMVSYTSFFPVDALLLLLLFLCKKNLVIFYSFW